MKLEIIKKTKKQLKPSIEKRQLLLHVILYRSEEERKKEREREGNMQAGCFEGKGKKGGPVTDIQSDGYSKQNFYEWNFVVTCQCYLSR